MKGLRKTLAESADAARQEARQARSLQRASALRVEEYLLRKGSLSREEMMDLVCEQLGVDKYDPERYPPDLNLRRLLPKKVALEHEVVPLKVDKDLLWVATDAPLEVPKLTAVEQLTGLDLEPVYCPREQLRKLLHRFYTSGARAEDVPESVGSVRLLPDENAPAETPQHPAAAADRHVTITGLQGAQPMQIIEKLLAKALGERASSILVCVRQRTVEAYLRVDGNLVRLRIPDRSTMLPALTRVKDMASLDISKATSFQEGVFSVRLDEGEVHVQVSSVPTTDGEHLSFLLPGHFLEFLDFTGLGLAEADQPRLRSALGKAQGLVLASGPRRHGRTTLLYTMLKEMGDAPRSVFTLESKRSYSLPGLNQVRVNPRTGMTYASGLETILHQQPDVVLVGRLDDECTARLAVDAALSGCLVLTAVEAMSATGALTRMLSLGVDPYALSSTLLASVNMRLVRRLCSQCRTEGRPEPRLLADLPIPEEQRTSLAMAAGCEACGLTGHHGRTGIYEVLTAGDMLRSMVFRERPFAEMTRAATEDKLLRPLKDVAVEKVMAGETSLEEIAALVY